MKHADANLLTSLDAASIASYRALHLTMDALDHARDSLTESITADLPLDVALSVQNSYTMIQKRSDQVAESILDVEEIAYRLQEKDVEECTAALTGPGDFIDEVDENGPANTCGADAILDFIK